MKTSKEEMAKIYRKMADNVERGIDAHSGIQFYRSFDEKWIDKDGTDTYKNILYRIKPETITLKNGVEIPKPLDHEELQSGEKYYFPNNNKYLYGSEIAQNIMLMKVNFIYATKEEAIEASKALFGIE